MNTQGKPNIVIILCDDLGYGDCSCYGQTTWQTPNIDRLAAGGTKFTDFYTTSPVCSPARTSLLTGHHSGHLPIRSLEDPYLPDDVPTLPWALKSAGYINACIGKYGVGNSQPDVDALRKGFDYHYGYNCMRHAHNYYPPFLKENGLTVPLRNRPPADDPDQWITGVGVAEVKIDYTPDFIEARALEFIEDCAQQEQPFFLHYCPTLPHANNEGEAGPDGMEVDTYGEFEHEDWKGNEKGFARMVQRIDITVGRVMDKLNSLGIENDTLVIFTSDNGPHNEGGHSVTRFNSSGGFQGYKRSLHEGGIRVPFIVQMPGTVQPSESAHHGYFPDILPTLCELCGAAEPEHDGISFLNTLKGSLESQATHDYLYFEYDNQIGIRKGDWKYYRKVPHAEDLYASPVSNSDYEALFDLSSDHTESTDIKTAHPELMEAFRAHITTEHEAHQPQPVPVSFDFGRGHQTPQ